jgi:RHS repeat-associated protein
MALAINEGHDGVVTIGYQSSRISTVDGTSYTYDGDGTRVKKSSGTLYWTGTDSNVLAESDVSGNISAEYIFFNGMRTSKVESPWQQGALFPGRSSGLCQNDGYALRLEHGHGGTRSGLHSLWHSDNGGAADHYEFTGKERDTESGSDYFGARYYGSAMARFTSADPYEIVLRKNKGSTLA